MLFFTKMQATGNDFIIIDLLKQKINYNLNILSKYLCNRNLSVGADGIIYVLESKISDFKMKIFNSDGTEAKMCGNGIRCLAKYIKEKYKVKNEFEIETDSGIRKIIFEDKEIIVNMEQPILDINKIPVYLPNRYKKNLEKEKIKIEDNEFEFYFLSVGNTHSVCFVPSIEKIKIEKYGKKIENFKYFPNRTNVEFVQILNKNEIKIRVWERGVGETLSCGTGACASAYVSIKKKQLNNNLTVHLKGGDLKILVNEKNEIILKGTAEFSFEGKIINL